MRFYKKESKYKVGNTRTINKFAWFPVTINGETRWLERVCYIEEYHYDASSDYYCNDDYYWVKKSFINYQK